MGQTTKRGPVASTAGADSLVLVPVMFTVVGATFVVVGVRNLRLARRFQTVAMRAKGVVTDLRYRPTTRTEAGSSGLWFPVLRFETADGRQVDTEAMYGRSPAPARIGGRVTVLYDPDDPTRAAIEGNSGSGLLGAVIVGFGLLLAVVGLLTGVFWVFVRYGP